MLSSILVSILAVSPLALAAPSIQEESLERRGFDHYGNFRNFGWGGRRRLDLERLRKHKNKQLLAAERKHHLNLDKDQALAAKNYRETNFGAEKDRKFDNAKIHKAKVAELAKEQALRKNLRIGGGGFWKRQIADDSDLGGDFDDESLYSPDSLSTSSPTNDYDSSPSSSSSSSPEGFGFGGGDFGGGLYDGGFGGADFGGGDFGGGGFDFLGRGEGGSSASPDSRGSPDEEGVVPDSSTASPDSQELSPQVQPDAGSLTKRGFGYGFGGGAFGGNRFRKNTRFRDAKLVRLAELENARRRKALEHAKVKFNTKKFNKLKFKNDLHLNKDNKAKEVALADRKNVDAERLHKTGGGFW